MDFKRLGLVAGAFAGVVAAGCGNVQGESAANAVQMPGAKQVRMLAANRTVSSAAERTMTVNELAASVSSHLGQVSVVGVVGVVKASKGFVLIDNKEYKECGLTCLNEAGAKKIPVSWTGALPKVGQSVRVDGILAKTSKGLVFTGQKVQKL